MGKLNNDYASRWSNKDKRASIDRRRTVTIVEDYGDKVLVESSDGYRQVVRKDDLNETIEVFDTENEVYDASKLQRFVRAYSGIPNILDFTFGHIALDHNHLTQLINELRQLEGEE